MHTGASLQDKSNCERLETSDHNHYTPASRTTRIARLMPLKPFKNRTPQFLTKKKPQLQNAQSSDFKGETLPEPQTTVLEGQGFTFARSKSKLHVVLRDDLFDQLPKPIESCASAGKLPPEITQLLNSLKQQVADLSLFLEEERMLHNQTKRKATDFMRDKVEEMRRDKAEALRRKDNEHNEIMALTSAEHQKVMDNVTTESYNMIAKLQTEMEFLQGNFKSFRGQTIADIKKEWKEKEQKLVEQHMAECQEKLEILSNQLKEDSQREISAIQDDHIREISSLKKDCRREIDHLTRRTATCNEELNRFKATMDELKLCKQANEELLKQIEGNEKELIQLRGCVADTAALRASFELELNSKVSRVEAKFREESDKLMQQNADLRRMYRKKCEEYFGALTELERLRAESAKLHEKKQFNRRYPQHTILAVTRR